MLTEFDIVRKAYFETIEQTLGLAQSLFRCKQYEECYRQIKVVIKICLHSYDLPTLLAVVNLRALTSVYFDRYLKAIKDLKTMRAVADDLEDWPSKVNAYEMMG